MNNNWRVFWDPNDPDYEANIKIARGLSNDIGISEFLGKLLVSRGLKDKNEAVEFLNPSKNQVIDPFYLKDMDKAVFLLKEIKQKEEKIVVFGDYDVDGVTAAATLYMGLKDLGFNVDAYIPSRMDEGYSLNMDAISDFNKNGFKNIITVDCGITSIEEISFAKKLGMKVIVTDHHEQQENLPPADAVVNPKRKDNNYPFKGLAGVGVAFKVLLALSKEINPSFDPYNYIDLVAIGTIADIVPLLSENRYFVKRGLDKIRKNPLKGVEALLKELKIVPSEIKSHIIAYKVAPKINAAGRMADAFTAFKLLTSKNDSEIQKNVSALIKLNSKRQAKEKEIYLFALSQMDVNPEYKKDKVIVLSGDNWHLGVLGIVASKLSSQFNKPVLMISKEETFGKGSARSPQGINLMDLFKNSSKEDLFQEFGGHELAAGFSVPNDNLDLLRTKVNESYFDLYGEKKPISEVSIDMEIEKIWPTFFDEIEKLEPYGYKNPEPVFLMKNVKAENMKFFGNAVESFAGKIRNKKDLIMDIIGYGLAPNLKEARYNNPTSIYLDIVGNFRQENSYNLKHKFLKFYLKDLNLKSNEQLNKDISSLDINSILKEETYKVSKIDVIKDNISENKIAMFLPSRIKYAAMLKKIFDSINNNKKVVIIGASNIVLKHTYNIISSYISSSNMYFNKKSRINNKTILNQKIIFITVPAFFHNLKMFSSDIFEIIIDEPFYSMAHPAIKNIKEYTEFRKYIIFKKNNISSFGTLFHTSLKEYFKRAGFKVLVSNVSPSNYEIIREKKKLSEILNDYINENINKVIMLNDETKQTKLSKIISDQFNILEDSIKVFNNSMEFTYKLLVKENFKKNNSNILISSYSNNGLSMELKGKNPIFIILDVPKTRLELIDIVASWSSKKGVIKFVLAYDEKFRARLSYDFARMYPSSNVLKQTYDFIKNNPSQKENEIINKMFKGDIEFGKVVLDELTDTGLIINLSNKYEVFEDFNLKLLHNSVKNKESILDGWLIKDSIHFFEDIDSKKFMELFKTNITDFKFKGV
ncbi:single-stranded-DNA-specific exonuclease RecJ [Oceanotoga teriensis]|uniref:single-stranded-DNA-specific exonuclease RecJ n=1 Tax=Oceanotoga teriensis TaxID=515440 RepID=UPI0027130811|nr:single-stranded-DNA-specific exonuclease RecJ [Oceanotoga teriensis]MDO7975589.1 single-stranded-DNA-specific exonuclease RecJ [Oceanotoga teriensis]